MKRRQLFLVAYSFFVLISMPVHAQKSDTAKTTPSSVIADDDDGGHVFIKSEVEASVDMVQWRKHLESNLMPILDAAAKAGIKSGTYTVYVRFIVEKDGSISDVKALNDVGYGLTQGAIKVVRTGPKWKAGEQNGRKVRSYHTQPIGFMITEK